MKWYYKLGIGLGLIVASYISTATLNKHEPSKERVEQSRKLPENAFLNLHGKQNNQGITFSTLDNLIMPNETAPCNSLQELYEKMHIIDNDYQAKDKGKLEKFLKEEFERVGYNGIKSLSELPDLLKTIHKIVVENVTYFDKAYNTDFSWDWIIRDTSYNVAMELYAKYSHLGSEERNKKVMEEHETLLKSRLGKEKWDYYKKVSAIDKMSPEEVLYHGVGYCRHLTKIYSMIFDYLKEKNSILEPVYVDEFAFRDLSGNIKHVINSVLIYGKNPVVTQSDPSFKEYDHSDNFVTFRLNGDNPLDTDTLLKEAGYVTIQVK